MANTVTYRDLPHDIEPLDFLFRDVRLTVPESRFTPELTVEFYRRMIEQIDMNALHAKSERNPWGLQSLPSMLRYEPEHYGQQWLRLEADTKVIEAALPERTPYQLLYLPLFPFRVPKWENIPVKEKQGKYKNENHLGEIGSRGLFVGKNGKLYYVSARYEPAEQYYAITREPRASEEGPYVFNLYRLYVGQWSWDDPQLLSSIMVQKWTNLHEASTRVQCALNGTAEILESRAGKMRGTAELLEQMSIYSGR